MKALSPQAFPEALDSCFGGELLRYANLTPKLELDAERNELRKTPPTWAVKTTGIERSVMENCCSNITK